MTYSIIPDYSDIPKTLEISEKYDARFEYNDFCMPFVYENDSEIKKRIEYYVNLNRDRSNDTMHGAFLALDIAARDSVIRNRSIELYEKSLEIADRLGIKGVVFHTGLLGTLRVKYYLNAWLEASVEFWSEKCRQYPNLTIYMENTFEQEPDIFENLMERMMDVPNFKLCLDYGHAILTPTPIEQWCKAFAPYIGHMHLNDNDLRDDLHLVPGQGKIDFDKWKVLMEENHIDTSVLLEIYGCDKALAALEYMRNNYGK